MEQRKNRIAPECFFNPKKGEILYEMMMCSRIRRNVAARLHPRRDGKIRGIAATQQQISIFRKIVMKKFIAALMFGAFAVSFLAGCGNTVESDRERGIIFSGDGKTLVRYNFQLRDTKYTIPKGVTAIGENAFKLEGEGLAILCENQKVLPVMLKTVIIPDGVTSIGGSSFYNCATLTKVSIPDSVKKIEDYAFGFCKALDDVVIPNGVEEIGDEAFSCSGIKKISIPSSVKSIGQFAFSNCANLKELPNLSGITEIKYGAFMKSGLEKIAIPDNVRTINNSAFKMCKNLTSVDCGKGVTDIQEDAFNECENLENVKFPDSSFKIGEGAFANCAKLTEINLGAHVYQIGARAFLRTGIKHVRVPAQTKFTVDSFRMANELHSEPFNKDCDVTRY